EDYQQLKLRLSAKTNDVPNKMFLALNPVQCWLQDILNKEDFDIIKSTYKDNPFLTPDYIKMLEDLKYQNEHLYRIYVLGEFSKLPNLIYNNYEIISDDEYNKIVSETIYGLDFGFNNPTALVEVKICDDKIFLREMLYKTNLTNQDLINYLKELEIKKNCEIYCDGAEPQRIEELYKAGFNAKPSKKEVIDGIDLIKRKKLYITKSSSSLIKEIKSYSYKIDKAGKILEEPVKFNDHLMDAMRYAIYTHTKDYSFKIKAYKSLIRDIDFK
ncbi:MAG TPA: phage terminase large subunit, partial [Elusimicrobiales bacterium]|nr:phage terminase large subunit [Elusimicrobiales bacterium]